MSFRGTLSQRGFVRIQLCIYFSGKGKLASMERALKAQLSLTPDDEATSEKNLVLAFMLHGRNAMKNM